MFIYAFNVVVSSVIIVIVAFHNSYVYLFILCKLLEKPLFMDTFCVWCSVRSNNQIVFPGVECV
jgi:hypothetical protein